ncbi:hypothetical protein MGN70_002285 [Eutypa lata]|nr:hypothetical protein MGN70_002285 [Eutypa lata]
MDSTLEQLRTLAIQADDAGRHKVLDFIRDLQLRLETPHDTLSRFSGMHLEITAARIAEDLGIFQILGDSGEHISAVFYDIWPLGMVHETSANTFSANVITRTLAQPGYRGGIYHFFDNVGPVMNAFPAFLAETNLSESVPVDVGGGFGHQCAALLAAFPELRGKLVLQELPQTLAQLTPQLDGVDLVAQDFFPAQQVREARFYYLHDWPDEKCIVILEHLVAALGPLSQILIDEMVLPDTGVPWEAAAIDLTMMASLGSRERTVKEWYGLLEAAGLRVVNIYTYVPRRQDSIIQVVPN